MRAQAPSAFGNVLTEYRLAAGLTQDALAERAGLSARTIQALEGGRNQPFKDTAHRLAGALGLDERRRALLLAAAVPTPRRRGSGSARVAQPAGAEQAPASSPSVRHNLPAVLSSFVGREHERGTVHQLLATHRLVTLIGAGGVGKTRLALTVAQDMVESYPDGVWLVELAALASGAAGGALVAGAVARALGVREETRRPLLETLADRLRGKQMLLVLDNCEHLIEACAKLAGALLRAAPMLHILATSREALRVAGEQRYCVPSLSVPDTRRLPALELADAYEAVRLFVQRAREQRPDFALTEGNTRAAVEICVRLDGIPLAIELAVAQLGSLGVAEIAARLDDRFHLLTGGARDALPRQQTLRATMDWSYDLLNDEERALLARLSVFAGGWTLAAAEVVCLAVPHTLHGLAARSLVQVDDVDGDARYRLLETVRQYGAARLAASDAEEVRNQHLRWYLALAEEAEPELRGAEQERWLARLEAEHDNFRAALTWAREAGWWELGLRLAGALWRFWSMRGYFDEGQQWLDGLLAGGEGASPATRARALNAAGDLAAEQGDLARELVLQDAALTLWRALGNSQGIAASLNRLAWVASLQGDFVRAVRLREECLALMRALTDAWGTAYSLHHLAWVLGQQGHFSRATALQEEGLALWRALGDRWGMARALGNLGRLAGRQGDYARAAALHEESLALYRERADKPGIAATLGNLGWLAGQLGDFEQASAQLEESLTLQRDLGDKRGTARSLTYLGWVWARQGEGGRATALCVRALQIGREVGARDLMAEALETLAWVTAECGRADLAARLGGAAEVLRAALGVPVLPALRADHAQAVRTMRAALGDETFTVAWAAGRALSLRESVALAQAGHIVGE